MVVKPSCEALSLRVKALERSLRLCRRQLARQNQEKNTAQKYLDIAGVIIVAIDRWGRVTLVNRKGCEIIGLEESDIVGRDWFECFVPEAVREEVRGGFRKLMAGRIENMEYFQNPLLNQDGEERIIAWHNSMLRDEAGRIVGTLSSGEDVTQRVQAEDALREAHAELGLFNQELERMVQERTEELKDKNLQLIEAERMAALGKIANRVAHEIRNPLTVVGGFARRLLEKTPDEDPSKKYLKIIVREVGVLENRVSQIIRIEKGERI